MKLIDFFTVNFFVIPSANTDFIIRMQNETEKLKKKYEGYEDSIGNFESTYSSTFVGTADYVSPELLEENECGPAGDLWALGCIIYQMATGKLPFASASEFLTFQKIKQCQPEYPPVIFFFFLAHFSRTWIPFCETL
jgi:3-phosphoinositide dependent protein kinase-1